MTYKITPINAFKDNYIWAIASPENSEIIVVDPGDADPVIEYLQKNNCKLHAILLTHHHWDHSNGIALLRQQFPHVPAYGPEKEKVAGITHFVKEGSLVSLFNNTLVFQVLDIPGHTLGHIAYVGEQSLFCGDTLFSAGCGRIFEGSPEQMFASLAKLKSLTPDTLVYCGHEYTVANLQFARLVEPNNFLLQQRLDSMLKLRALGHSTLPSTIKDELKINPFLRCEENAIIQSVQNHFSFKETDPIKIFASLREWKNQAG